MNKRSKRFWIELVVLLLIIAAGAAALIVSEMRPLNKEDLKIEAGDLRALAAAGRLVAIQYTKGDTTDTFFRNQTELIETKVSNDEDSLQNAEAKPEVGRQLAELVSLAGQTPHVLGKMKTSSDVSTPISELDSITYKFKNLEDELKR
jgi:hypothetical protein